MAFDIAFEDALFSKSACECYGDCMITNTDNGAPISFWPIESKSAKAVTSRMASRAFVAGEHVCRCRAEFQ